MRVLNVDCMRVLNKDANTGMLIILAWGTVLIISNKAEVDTNRLGHDASAPYIHLKWFMFSVHGPTGINEEFHLNPWAYFCDRCIAVI